MSHQNFSYWQYVRLCWMSNWVLQLEHILTLHLTRGQWCWQELPAGQICRQPLQWELHNNHRSRLQDQNNRVARGEGEAADLGHGGSGEVPHHHQHLLPRHTRGDRGVRRHQRRELCQCEEVASRDWCELWCSQQNSCWKQEWWSREKGDQWSKDLVLNTML